MINYDLIGRAMLHPTAAAILEAFRVTPVTSPVELSQVLDQSLCNVSYHVGVLAGKRKGGPFANMPLLIEDHTEPRRGAVEHFYRLTDAATISDKR